MADDPGDGAAARLFDDAARHAAARLPADHPFRPLALDEDDGARALRGVLQRGFVLARDVGEPLKRALAHATRGQHTGALAHLLTLALLEHEGFSVVAEPRLHERTPDVLARSGAHTLLLEVRAVTGAGRPWGGDAHAPRVASDDLRPSPGGTRRDEDARQRARRRAAARLLSQRADADALHASLLAVIRAKAETYAELTAASGLPYVIVLYEDVDPEVSRVVRRWVVREHGLRDAGAAMSHVSALLVFGRTASAPLRWHGEVLPNVAASRPLPDALRFPHLACWRAADGSLVPPAQPVVPFELPGEPADG